MAEPAEVESAPSGAAGLGGGRPAVSPSPAARAWQRARSEPLTWVITGFSFLYSVTLFPGVGGRINHGDSAKFQFIGRVLGLSHPPGNPLYILLNALWVRIPMPFTAATQVSLLSAVFAVVTLFFVYRTLHRLFGVKAALAGTVALGAGPLFWTFATEAEVYSLNTLLLAAACFYALEFTDSGERRPFLLGALFYSLSFANHLTSVVFLPAFSWLILARVRRGTRVRLRDAGIVAAFAAFSAAMYLYIPWRFGAGTVYSELGDKLDLPTFWGYVTAKEFQGSFGQVSFVAAVRERMPAFLSFIQKQWMWPTLFLIPSAIAAFRERAPDWSRFTVVALLCLLFFALEYDISDPDGFYMPIVLLLSFWIGGAMSALDARSPRLAWIALGTLLAVPAGAHVVDWLHHDGNEVVEGMDNETGIVLWDLDRLFERLPEGATFAVPCWHYGCTEVLNYYRYTAAVVQRRHISFVRFPNTQPDYWDTHTKLEKAEYEAARKTTICTIRKPDADAMRAKRIPIHEDFLPTRDMRSGTIQGATIYCSGGSS
jgi:hypothetical protein